MDYVVYTSLVGDIDPPRDDVVCFHNSYRKFNSDRRNSRVHKILSHKFLDTEWSIYIDANLFLRVEPEELLDMAGSGEVLVFNHPRRSCVYKEGEEVIRKGLAQPSLVRRQLERYRSNDYPEENGLYCGFLIVRRHTENIKRLNEKWWSEYCIGCERDQISFPYSFQEANVTAIDVKHQKDNEFFRRVIH